MKLVPSILGLVLLFAGVCCTWNQPGVQPVKVQGIAMSPTLNDGDLILVARSFDELERGNIVVFYYPPDPSQSHIKRIIGLPGEEVEISERKVLINGKVLEESYVNPTTNQSRISFSKISLPNDNFYVMGDNRDNSNDSRLWGPLPRKFIYGKFVTRYAAAK
jgi:signal peptidase I